MVIQVVFTVVLGAVDEVEMRSLNELLPLMLHFQMKVLLRYVACFVDLLHLILGDGVEGVLNGVGLYLVSEIERSFLLHLAD